MKRILNISVVANLALLAAVVFLLAGRRKENVTATSASVFEGKPQAAEPIAAVSKWLQTVKPKSFHWSQLESADYQTYIFNLRGVGCPEQTIRDIITADLDATVYAPRREELNQSRASSKGKGLLDLNKEEAGVIAALLGGPDSSKQASVETPASPRSLRDRSKEALIAMPLVLQNVDAGGLGLDTNRLNVVANLRQRFLNEIGGPGQDPNDPGYRERWQKAQANANDRLQAMLGMRAYQVFEMKARAAALAPANTVVEKP